MHSSIHLSLSTPIYRQKCMYLVSFYSFQASLLFLFTENNYGLPVFIVSQRHDIIKVECNEKKVKEEKCAGAI